MQTNLDRERDFLCFFFFDLECDGECLERFGDLDLLRFDLAFLLSKLGDLDRLENDLEGEGEARLEMLDRSMCRGDLSDQRAGLDARVNRRGERERDRDLVHRHTRYVTHKQLQLLTQ